jgi:hypothetical protein
MQQFIRAGKTYWGGIHRTLGVLIYDQNDQRGLTEEKIRLYIVNEKRLATFVQSLVLVDLVPTHLETWWCRTHEVVMQSWHNVKGTWWSHPVAGGTWCTGQAKPTKARPRTT